MNNDGMKLKFSEEDLAVLTKMTSFLKRRGNINSQKNWELKSKVSSAFYNFIDDLVYKRDVSISSVMDVFFKEELQPILYENLKRQAYRTGFSEFLSGSNVPADFKEGICNSLVEGFCSNLILSSTDYELEKKRKKKKNEEATGEFQLGDNFSLIQSFISFNLPKFEKALSENNLWGTLLNARLTSYTVDGEKSLMTGNFAQQLIACEYLRANTNQRMEKGVVSKKIYDMFASHEEFKKTLQKDDGVSLGVFFFKDGFSKVNPYEDIAQGKSINKYKYGSGRVKLGEFLNIIEDSFITYPKTEKVTKLFPDHFEDVHGFKALSKVVWIMIMEEAVKLNVPSIDRYLTNFSYENVYSSQSKNSSGDIDTLTRMFTNLVDVNGLSLEELEKIREVVGKKVGIDLFEMKDSFAKDQFDADYNRDYEAELKIRDELKIACDEEGLNSVRVSEIEISLKIAKELNSSEIKKDLDTSDGDGFSRPGFKL